ncbi:MAG: hypothetical protein ABS882_00920 [Lysinibacillus sp.]
MKLFAVTILVVGLPVGGVMAYNYYIDPFWTFTHENEDNAAQLGFNERIQKTNWLNARAPLQANSLMIGTSRTTYINADNFDKPLFHYGLSSLHITEYLDFMKYAEKQNGQPFETIYMEITSRSYDTAYRATFTNPNATIAETNKEFYRITNLFSYDTYLQSKENAQTAADNFSPKPRIYDRDMNVTTFFESKDIDRRLELYQYNIDKREKRNGFENLYNPEYKQILLDIKESFPNANFVAFNDVMLMDRLHITLSNEHLRAAYKRNIEEVVDVFGVFYSFHIENDITTEHSRYFDLFHFYPETGDEVAKALQQPDNSPLIFAVTKDNMNEYFALLGI